ncbi:MAG: class I SAM-dependent methyltransferase [Fidelibacterota bacterium]
MSSDIKNICDFCGSHQMRAVYKVPDSQLHSVICLCQKCGLVQSNQTSKEKNRQVSISCDADWGNIRHGKGIRLKPALDVLNRHIQWDSITSVLDVGSNRGKFITWIDQNHPQIQVTAVEPDSRIINDYPTTINPIVDRFENVDIELETQDLIMNCHTLEHSDSAFIMIQKMKNILKPNGWLYVDVPNLQVIEDPFQIEQFFIDKHTFHFHRSVLRNYLECQSFQVKFENDPSDRYNIILLCQKSKNHHQEYKRMEKGEIRQIEQLIRDYKKRLIHNRKQLKTISSTLHKFMHRQITAIWGSGKILDALIKYGGLKLSDSAILIDEYLYGIISEVHGIQLNSSSVLRNTKVDAVVILARSATKEIIEKIKRFGIYNIITYEDLWSGITRYDDA